MPNKLSYKYVRKQIKKENYKLLSAEYKNARSHLQIQCEKGHIYSATYDNFSHGSRCPICAIDVRAQKLKLSYYSVKRFIESKGYKLLSNGYKNHATLLYLQCPKGHQYYVKYNNFHQGQRCPYCWNLKPKAETEFFREIKKITTDVITNCRTQIINPQTKRFLELDIWIPSLNKAIEFNGEYWHKNNYKDRIKIEECNRNNIDLMVVWYEDWNKNKNKTLEKVKQFLEAK